MKAAVPRGAVAIVCVCVRTSRIALVTRARPPDQSTWALPGGKIELGEPTMLAASRELHEECNLGPSDVQFAAAHFTASDVIRPAPGASDPPGTTFHYLLAQTFCRTQRAVEPEQLRPGDDAGEARWFTLREMEELQERNQLASGVQAVVARGMLLYERGLLPLEGD